MDAGDPANVTVSSRPSEAMAPAAPLLRGLCMAIIDEADAILIDEARVPLILSLPAAAAPDEVSALTALGLAQALQEGLDFRLDPTLKTAQLNGRGREKLEAAAAALKQWRFQPATRNGEPVDLQLSFTVNFSLK